MYIFKEEASAASLARPGPSVLPALASTAAMLDDWRPHRTRISTCAYSTPRAILASASTAVGREVIGAAGADVPKLKGSDFAECPPSCRVRFSFDAAGDLIFLGSPDVLLIDAAYVHVHFRLVQRVR